MNGINTVLGQNTVNIGQVLTQFCATWKLLIPRFQQFEQCIPWIIQSKGQFGGCAVISREIPCPPHVQHQLCPWTRALWPHRHILSSSLAEGEIGKGRIRSWLHTKGLRELRRQQLPGTTYRHTVWFWKARNTSCTFLYWTPCAITPSAWFYQMRLLNIAVVSPFHTALHPQQSTFCY